MQLTVALVAEEGAGVRTLRLLVNRGHNIVAVFTRNVAAGSDASVASSARALALPIRDSTEVREPETAEWIRDQRVDIMLNVHSLEIVHAAVLEAPRLGAYNLHPGPLPEWAGLHTPSWAVYEGASDYGVTLHRMASEVDAGPIAFTDSFEIGPTDTGLSVLTQCVRAGLPLVERLVEAAERGKPIPALPQDLAKGRWFDAGPPHSGRVDWRLSARQIESFVRACDYRPFRSPWGFPRCSARDLDVAIRDARVIAMPRSAIPGTTVHTGNGAVLVAARDGWLRVEKLEIRDEIVAAADAIADGVQLR